MAENGNPCPIAPGPKTLPACISDWNSNTTDIPTQVTMDVLQTNGVLSFCRRAEGAMNKIC
ncbi:hypothetical protein BGX33_003368 [Mortierella sp. NVP41]|nr:hypothetical protein BGX33_003368 [Mortierella sp. NVP41]